MEPQNPPSRGREDRGQTEGTQRARGTPEGMVDTGPEGPYSHTNGVTHS